jgi:hypothetical protein
MLVEEVKKAKELAAVPKAKKGDDEPDWQDVSFITSINFDQNTLFWET